MGGDFSRITFQPGKRFAGVLLQQGRVQLDSDWNEADAIREHERRILVRDLFGHAAFVGDSFALSAAGERLTVAAGHAWVDGLLCELPADVDADDQPDMPGSRTPTAPGAYLAWLEAWQREVSATQDPTLLDPALGGSDTATRRATVVQVRFRPITADNRRRRPDLSIPDYTADVTLAVHGGYDGAENRLYRVQVHDSGKEPTFTWSRNNGSTAAAVRSWAGRDLRLAGGSGHFAPGDLLEVVDRASVLGRRPGLLVRVERAKEDVLAVTGDLPDHPVDPLVRRWDGGPVPVQARGAGPIELEAGLSVEFSGSTFRSGDFWVFSARPADRSVRWTDAADAAGPRPPHGIEVVGAPLAIVDRRPAGWTVRRDLRTPLRPPGRP